MKSSKFAFSSMGFAIVVVIIIGIGMIISAPMLAGKYQKSNNADFNKEDIENRASDSENTISERERSEMEHLRDTDPAKQRELESKDYSSSNTSSTNVNYVNMSQYNELFSQMRRIEESSNDRFNRIEQVINNLSQSETNKYVCTIEGYVDENGNMVPLKDSSGTSSQRRDKFVFVCEYRR